MSTIAARRSLDWLDQNMHTSYPFAFSSGQQPISTDGRTLPSSFIVDMQLLVDNDCIGMPYAQTQDDVREGFFMSKVVKLQDMLTIEISFCGSDNVVYKVAQSAGIPLGAFAISGDESDILRARTFALSPCGSSGHEALDNVYGTVVIGTCADMEELGTLVFAKEDAAILSQRVSLVDTGMRYVMVNGTRITSNFTLNAGDGVTLDVSTDDVDGTTVTVSSADAADAEYSSVDDVVAAVLDALGHPVRLINGIPPDKNGNFVVAGGDCTEVKPGYDTGGVQINNKCSKPCCGDVNKEQLEAAMSALSDAQARLLSYYQALTNNVNNVQARLATLLATR